MLKNEPKCKKVDKTEFKVDRNSEKWLNRVEIRLEHMKNGLKLMKMDLKVWKRTEIEENEVK